MPTAAFLGSIAALLVAAPPAPPDPASDRSTPNPPAASIEVNGRPLPVPTPQQAAWHDLEVGMFIHLGPQTWQDKETDDLSTPASAINPEKLDTDQWVRVAESMGAKYIVFVAKHEGGFCWWPTDTTDYSVRSSPWRAGKGDVLKDLSASCKKRGMKLGVYVSPQDRTHGVGIGGKSTDPSKQAEYQQLFRAQLEEVLSRYGNMMEVWFDGSLVFDVGDILARHAPTAMAFQGPHATIRWVGNEDGIAPPNCWNAVKFGAKPWGMYTGRDSDPDGDRWLPNECDARIRATWFWRTDNQHTLKSLARLMDMYEQSVGRGGVLLLNNTPDRSGLIPEADAARSAELGSEITRVYGPGSAIAESGGNGREITVQPSAPSLVDRVVIMEDITKGERVRAYELEALINGKWKAVASGQAIGHKRIVRIEPAPVEAVRIRITQSVGEPIIRSLSLHRAAPDGPAKDSKP